MKIGLTYDLRQDYLAQGYSLEETAEFDSPATIDALEAGIQAMGFVTERIGNLKALMRALTDGKRWDLVFNIAEGMHGFAREAQVPALLEAYAIPCVFSDPMVLGLCLHKAVTKRILRDLKLPTPEFSVVETMADVDMVDLDYPLFAKPVAEGTSKGIHGASLVDGRVQLRHACSTLLERFRQPVLVERFLSGREFTVGIVGSSTKARPLGVMEILLLETADQLIYSQDNKEEYEERVRYILVQDELAAKLSGLALDAWRGLGCRDGGRVDIRLDGNGNPHILEINPLPGLHPIRSDLSIMCAFQGIPHGELIRMIMESALERIGHAGSATTKRELVLAA
ncbi:D-alanine--D-alanine ligase [Desulfonatronum thiosulfatophilum]|uniref:D-alanine--D-alanine ligase n=1 Tax=Desulfonatronum thiosulfatophilum TaxID=617002 RepID=A0A1G6C2T2_9BACT|nr:ATP-grasp domain-containing protein [Desulfonatronum thiosulfatophilum]SDB27116.1 D-alanine--D-alanine ligase [Desulfonatronum thiosulfatophilum]